PRNSDPFVRYLDRHPPIDRDAAADGDRLSPPEFGGVRDQVQQDLAHALGIGDQLGNIGSDLQTDGRAVAFRQGQYRAEEVVQKVVELNLARVQYDPPG